MGVRELVSISRVPERAQPRSMTKKTSEKTGKRGEVGKVSYGNGKRRNSAKKTQRCPLLTAPQRIAPLPGEGCREPAEERKGKRIEKVGGKGRRMRKNKKTRARDLLRTRGQRPGHKEVVKKTKKERGGWHTGRNSEKEGKKMGSTKRKRTVQT